MSGRRYAARRDKNEPEIVEALENAGAVVVRLSPPALDLLVGYGGETHLIEVKSQRDTSEGGAHGITADQFAFISRWELEGGPVHVVTTPAEALAAIGAEV